MPIHHYHKCAFCGEYEFEDNMLEKNGKWYCCIQCYFGRRKQ